MFSIFSLSIDLKNFLADENLFFSIFSLQITLTTFSFLKFVLSILQASVAISKLCLIAKLFKLIISFVSIKGSSPCKLII